MVGCAGDGPKPQQLESKGDFAIMRIPAPDEQLATFAGGCFWAMQECMIELKGVHNVISGYSGGTASAPTYASVLAKNTGHAEAVQVYYDPKVISFEQLVTAFFHAHDPTEVDRQGPDIGSDYRSIAFFRTPEEYRIIQKAIVNLDASSGRQQGKTQVITTEVLPFKVIYPAETEHQDYYKHNSWDGYIRNVSKPKVMKLRKEMPALIKSEYLK